MYRYIKNTLLFISLYLLGVFSIQASSSDKSLPPILDHYPNCDYVIIESASAKGTSIAKTQNKTISAILIKLQRKAKAVGADALILTDKSVKKNISYKPATADPSKYKYLTQYTAEFIKQCKEADSSNRKLAKYSPLGQRVTPILNYKSTVNFQFAQSKKEVKEVRIENNEVSIKNGLYGAQLNGTYQEVIAKLGSPSTVVNIMKDELIVGYGRRHWLHFQSNKLVKVQTSTSLLSQSALNKIPLREVFDDDSWAINNKVTAGMSRDKVLDLTGPSKPELKNNQLIFSQSGKTLKLNFFRNKNHHTEEVSNKLESFILQVSDYRESKKFTTIEHNQQLKLIKQMYVLLELDQEVNLPILRSKLGKPIAQMRLNNDSALEIYNSFLTLEVKNSELTKMYLNQDNLLSKEYSNNNSWALGKFTNGTPRKQLAKYFPQSSYESYNEVEIQSDKYTLSLLFDDESQSSRLNEAELSFWF